MIDESLLDDSLTRRMGFRSKKKTAMTNAERQQKYRRTRGNRQVQIELTADIAASMLYLRKEWGMTSSREVIKASIRFLTLCTRQGLQRLPQTLDD